MINTNNILNIDELKEWLLKTTIIRYSYLLYTISLYLCYKHIYKNTFTAASATLRYERLVSSLGLQKTSPLIKNINDSLVQTVSNNNMFLMRSFTETKLAQNYRDEFNAYGDDYAARLKYPKVDDNESRQGDLLVMKPYINNNEKGVLFVQYNDSFLKCAAIYDLHKLSEYYRFILEPSTWGYQDCTFFLFLGLNTDVIIEAQYETDYEYIRKIGYNFYPIRMGAGDWVDPVIFNTNNSITKVYDIVMVANWLKLKRHRVLFHAVRNIKSRIGKIALIGYPRDGRTIEDIKREAIRYDILDKLDFFENISPEEVNNVIQQSRIGVMLSKREGANKGIYECLFCNVPVILTEYNVGVNRAQINSFTGIIASDADLSHKIIYLLDNIGRFSPRAWAFENTGYMKSHIKLNNMLKSIAKEKGEYWTTDIFRKKNATNAMYVDEHDQLVANMEINKLKQYLIR